jgi:hypothetical protein
MKTKLLFLVLAFASFLNFQLLAQVVIQTNAIHSTEYGGLWPTNTTWIEAVPSNSDSVVLLGPVSMLSYTGWCNSLNITTTGSLGGNGNQGSLFIYGSMYIDGAVLGSMNYVLQGNLVNNQPWTGVDNHLQFTGMDHSISCAAGASINAQLQASDSLHNFSLLSDVILNTTSASDFGFSQIDAGTHKLSVTSGQFNNCRLHSSDTLQFDAIMGSLEITGDYKITGNMVCYINMAFHDKATNCGSISFMSGIGGDPLKLKGDFINKGSIVHSWVQVEKNITNDGTWATENTEFTGVGDKHISQSAGHPFGGTQFTSDNSGSQIYLDTDVEFTVPAFHLYNNMLNCGDHLLTSNTVFYDGVISSDAEIAGNNDFWNSTLTGNVMLSGNNRFSNLTTDGVIENKGTMRDIQFYGGWYSSYNHLINRNSIQSLSMRIYGDLTNEGTIDNNSNVEITGNIPQYINITRSIESPTYFFSNIEGNSYQWMKDGLDIQNQVSLKLSFSSLQLSDAGVYKCRVLTSTGETVYSREIIVDNVTSTPELELAVSDLKVFPNPFTDHAVLCWEQKYNEKIRIDLIDVNGNLVKQLANTSFQAGKNEFKIDVKGKLKPGQYLVRLISKGKTKTAKLICTR